MELYQKVLLILLLILLLSPIEIGFATDRVGEKKPVDLHEFILSYECRGGPSEKSLTAYWDHKGYSIGCGTPSYEGEKITRKEAIRRFYEYTDIRVALVRKHFPKLKGDQFTAVVSLASNNGTCYNFLRKGKLTRTAWLKCDKVRSEGGLKVLPGLTKRRIAEVELYFSGRK